MNYQLHPITAAFKSEETEHAFQESVFDDDLKANRLTLGLIQVLWVGYCFFDLYYLQDPLQAIALRTLIAVPAVTCILLLGKSALRKHHVNVTASILFMLGIVMSLIIGFEPTLTHNYYVGYIQGAVLLCVLLQVGFIKSAGIIISFLLGFLAAVSQKFTTDQASIQTVVLLSMFTICGLGCYFHERNRRNAFVKSQMILQKDKELQRLFDLVESDRERKVASMNMLVHFVKTPIHQIVGFSDIVLRSLISQEDSIDASGIESAQIIQTAAHSLNGNVKRLLRYHRLDEFETNKPSQASSLTDEFSEFDIGLNREINFTFSAEGTVHAPTELVRLLINTFTDYYNDENSEVTQIIMRQYSREGQLVIEIEDNGSLVGVERFEQDILPLQIAQSYLEMQESEWAMSLRTIHRICGLLDGTFSYLKKDQHNVFEMTIGNYEEKISPEQLSA